MTCSHHGRRDCRGLGSEPAAPIAAPHTAAFVAASAFSQPQDMGCSPSAPALLLPARGHAVDMDIDTAQLQPTVALLQLFSTPTQKSPPQPMEIEQPQMPSAVRDGLMEWMWTNTALNVQHLSVPALAGSRPPCPYRWTPSETPQLSLLPANQPLPCIPHRLVLHVVDFSPSLSSTVVIHAFVPVHSLGNSTLFGLAVRFQHVGLQSSHGGGAPRIFPLPISSRTYDLIHCASASATSSASFIACPS